MVCRGGGLGTFESWSRRGWTRKQLCVERGMCRGVDVGLPSLFCHMSAVILPVSPTRPSSLRLFTCQMEVIFSWHLLELNLTHQHRAQNKGRGSWAGSFSPTGAHGEKSLFDTAPGCVLGLYLLVNLTLFYFINLISCMLTHPPVLICWVLVSASTFQGAEGKERDEPRAPPTLIKFVSIVTVDNKHIS